MTYHRLAEKIALFYKMAQYGDRNKFLKAVGQASLSGPVPPVPGTPVSLSDKLKGTYHPVADPSTQTLNEYTPPPSDDAGVPVVNVEDLPKTPQAPQFPAIDKNIQDQLNQLLVPGGLAALKLDGKLGPETRKALQTFQSKFNTPATPANIKAQYLKEKHPELETKAPF